MDEIKKSNHRIRSRMIVYSGSFVLSLAVVVGAPYVAHYAGASRLAAFLQLLWLPGLTLASTVFGSIHSMNPANMDLYLGLSFVIDAFVWMWPIVLTFGCVSARRDGRIPGGAAATMVAPSGSMKLERDETKLVGKWVEEKGHVLADTVCERIKWLTSHYLEKITVSKQWGAWETLFKDPVDGRYWEQT